MAHAQHKPTVDTSLSFFRNPHGLQPPVFENFPINSTSPAGWIKAQMQEDLENGFVGHLDDLIPKVMKEDIYHTARRKSKTDIPNAGTQELTGAAWEISMQWWNSESQGNWWDGYMRSAFLTNNKAAIKKTADFVQHIMASQDADGYIGIYGKDLRYQHEGDNGELWSQATLFRMLLGYYEMTGDKKVLHAVLKAMDLTMSKYNDHAVSPFKAKTDFGGLTHGLMMTDVCETLNRITGDQKYNDFAVYLYKEFSTYRNDKMYNDLRYEYLKDRNLLFVGHGAHTYEHLRSLLITYTTTGYPEMRMAYENALHKLSFCLLPGGGGIGDEWIGGRKADADLTGAEYCGLLELRNFYLSALQKTGVVGYADKAERLTFNDMQGARSADGKGITYCKTDNCIRLDYTSPQSGYKEKDPRFKYSPTHSDAAVCCNPSYSRNLPYYLSNMFMKAKDGIAVVLYGPAALSTDFNGAGVTITQQTNYPLSDEIGFTVAVSKPVSFALYFRRPEWSKNMKIDIPGASVKEENGFVIVTKEWVGNSKFQILFENEIQTVPTFNDQIALQRGAIVYAHPIRSKEKLVKDYGMGGFKDIMVLPDGTSNADYAIHVQHGQTGLTDTSDQTAMNPWYSGTNYLKGNAFNSQTNKLEPIQLLPMGSTVLRKTTFRTIRQ
jgi:DUF1680 family protein